MSECEKYRIKLNSDNECTLFKHLIEHTDKLVHECKECHVVLSEFEVCDDHKELILAIRDAVINYRAIC